MKFLLKFILSSIDENDMNPIIIKPLEHSNKSLSEYVLVKNDWSFTNFTTDELTYLIRYAPQKSQCFWRKIDDTEGMDDINELITYPRIDSPYQKPILKCQKVENPVYQLVFNSSMPSYFRHSTYFLVTILIFSICIDNITK